MQHHSVSLSSYVTTIVRYRDLIRSLTWHDFNARYRGSMFGLLWAIINPLLTVMVFSFVFGTIFQARWGVQSDSPFAFVMIAMLGLIIHGILADALGRSPTLIVGQPSFVKKVVFPLEILPLTTVINAALNAALATLILLTVYIVVQGRIEATVLFLPLVLLPYLLLVLGIVLFVSSSAVYLRDLGQIVGALTMVTLFLAPVFYPITTVPERYRPLLYLNPLTFTVEQARAVAFFGKAPDWTGLLVYLAAAAIFTWLGLFWFQRSRKGFADVI